MKRKNMRAFYFLKFYIIYLFIQYTQALTQDITDPKCSIFPYCKICSNSNCLICLDGYEISPQNNKCSKSAASASQYPKIGFYFDTTYQQLQSCFPSCEMCKGPMAYQCLSCLPGYQEIVSYSDMFQCIKCEVNNCSRCDSDGKCLECLPSYSLDSNLNTCNQCKVQYCSKCVTTDICSVCQIGFSLQNNGSLCNLSSLDQTCQIYKCKFCTNGKCVLCEDGFYENGGFCSQCTAPCLTCRGESTACTSCKKEIYKDYYLQGTQCVTACNLQFYSSKTTGRCIECSSALEGCQSCIDQQTCTQCLDSTNYYISNNKCVRKCKAQQYIQMGSLQQIKSLQNKRFWELDQDPLQQSCQNCQSDITLVCKQCLGLSTFCEVCQDGYVNYNGKCLLNCPSNTYLVTRPDQKKCFDCMEGCDSCSNGQQCISCEQGFQLDQNKLCRVKDIYVITLQPKKCPLNYVFFNGYCMPVCPLGTNQISGKCLANDSCDLISFDLNNQMALCERCKDSSKFIFQGYCLPYFPQFINNISVNGVCLQTCNNNSFTVLQDYYFPQCAQQCPSNSKSQGYLEINKLYCIQTECKSGQYFDTMVIFSDQQDHSHACKQCHTSCLSCNGPTQYDCLQCQPNLVYQEYYLRRDFTPLYVQNTVIYVNSTYEHKPTFHLCQKTCNIGFRKSNDGICIKCLDIQNCEQCPKGTFLNGKQCIDQCSLDSQLIEEVNTKELTIDSCVSRKGLILLTSCSKQIGSLCLSLKFLTIQAIPQINNFNQTQSQLICNTSYKQQLSVVYDSNLNLYNITGLIPTQIKFSITCSLKDQNKVYYGASTRQIELLGQLTGDFSLSTDSAVSENDKVTLFLKNLRISNLYNSQLPYSFYVYTKYVDISGREQIFEILQGNQFINSDRIPKYQNLNLTIQEDFRIPLINYNQNLQIKVEVYSIVQGEKIQANLSKMIQIFSNTSLNKNFIQYNNQNTQQQLIQYLVNNFDDKEINDQAVISQIYEAYRQVNYGFNFDVELQRDVNIQKSYNYGFNSQFYVCDNNITCNGQGKCNKSQNYYEQCACLSSYIGEGCSWLDTNLLDNQIEFINKLIYNIVQNQQLLIIDESLEKKYYVLVQVMKSRHLISKASYYGIQTILFNLTDEILNQMTVNALSNILQIFNSFIDISRYLNEINQIREVLPKEIRKVITALFKNIQGKFSYEGSNLFVQFVKIDPYANDIQISFSENIKFILRKNLKRILQYSQKILYLISYNLPNDVVITSSVEAQFKKKDIVIAALSPVTINQLVSINKQNQIVDETQSGFYFGAFLKGKLGKAESYYSPECYIFKDDFKQIFPLNYDNFEKINNQIQLQCADSGFYPMFLGVQVSQKFLDDINKEQVNQNNQQESLENDNSIYSKIAVGLIIFFAILIHILLAITMVCFKGKELSYSDIKDNMKSSSNTIQQVASTQNQIDFARQSMNQKSLNIQQDFENQQKNDFDQIYTLNLKQQENLNQNIERKNSQKIIQGIKMDSLQEIDQRKPFSEQSNIPKIQEAYIPNIQVSTRKISLDIQAIKQKNAMYGQIDQLTPDSVKIIYHKENCLNWNSNLHNNQFNTNKGDYPNQNIQQPARSNQNAQLAPANDIAESSNQNSNINLTNNEVFDKILIYHSFFSFNISFESIPNFLRVMKVILNFYIITSLNSLIFYFLKESNISEYGQIIISIILSNILNFFISLILIIPIYLVQLCYKNNINKYLIKNILFYLIFAGMFTLASIVISKSIQDDSKFSILAYFVSTAFSIIIASISELLTLLYIKKYQSKKLFQFIRIRCLDF